MNNIICNNKKYKLIMLITITILYTLALFFVANNVKAVEAVPISGEMRINEDSTKDFVQNNLTDFRVSDNTYKFSEEKTIYLPYIRYSIDRIIVDKALEKSGIMYATKSIELNEATKGVQILFSNDTVRVNNNMEYAVIFSTGNVIIDSTIDKTALIFSNGTITLTENAKINEDLICYAKTLDMKGEVNGSILGTVNDTKIYGKINNDLRVITNNIEIEKDKVINGIYIETQNKGLNISEKYPNAVIKIAKEPNNTITNKTVIFNGITICLVFTLLYLLFEKLSKGKFFENIKDRTKKYSVFTVLGGAVTFMLMPIIILVLIMLTFIGLGIITIPSLIIYVGAIIVISMLSIFIVGGALYSYTKQRFLSDGKSLTDIIGVFATFASLYVLTKLPVVGGYISILISMFAMGMLITKLFKKEKIKS